MEDQDLIAQSLQTRGKPVHAWSGDTEACNGYCLLLPTFLKRLRIEHTAYDGCGLREHEAREEVEVLHIHHRIQEEDILPLADHYIRIYNQRMHKQILGLSQMTKDLFLRWSWPGNVRELKNTIEGAFNMESSAMITLDSVQGLLEKLERQTSGSDPAALEPPAAPAGLPSLQQVQEQLRRGSVDLKELLDEYESAVISEALRQTHRLNAAAEKLSMSPQKLQYRLERLGLKENQKNLIK